MVQATDPATPDMVPGTVPDTGTNTVAVVVSGFYWNLATFMQTA